MGNVVPVLQPLAQKGLLVCVGGTYDGQWVPDAGLTVTVWDGETRDTSARYHRMLITPPEDTPATYAHCYIAEGMHPDAATARLTVHLTRAAPPNAAALTRRFSATRSIPDA
jgi:hypothetical protein